MFTSIYLTLSSLPCNGKRDSAFAPWDSLFQISGVQNRMKLKICSIFLSFIALVSIGSQTGKAQSDRGSVSGHVTDSSGGVLQGA